MVSYFSKIKWQSLFCQCAAYRDYESEHGEYNFCSDEHIPWLLIVGSQETKKKQMSLRSALDRGVPKSFDVILERFSKFGVSFHRPKEVQYDVDAPSAETGFYLSETMGVDLLRCSNPAKLADYLANKAARGLTEKMWKQDHFNRFRDTSELTKTQLADVEMKCVFPEELVAEQLMTEKEAEVFFCARLDSTLLQYFRNENRSLEIA